MPKASEPPDEIDRGVGQRIKMVRRQKNLSQTDLAILIGCTFQQVQKYERGTNRVSASRLAKIAKALNQHPGYFFDDVKFNNSQDAVAYEGLMYGFAGCQFGAQVIRAWPNLKPDQRSAFANIAKSILGDRQS